MNCCFLYAIEKVSDIKCDRVKQTMLSSKVTKSFKITMLSSKRGKCSDTYDKKVLSRFVDKSFPWISLLLANAVPSGNFAFPSPKITGTGNLRSSGILLNPPPP